MFESANPAVVRRFWQRVLDYAPGDDGGLADPLRRDPALRVRHSAEVRPLRNRIHLDVVRPAAAVEQADLGEPFGPFGVCHTDPDGNEVDLVPGDALGETTGTADWQAVFSAMACYRTTSPTQQRDLAAAAAALAHDTGFPLLVDLRPGLAYLRQRQGPVGSRRPRPRARLHRPRRRPPDRGPRARCHRGSGAAALRPALPRRCRRHRSPRVLARRPRLHPRPASRGLRHPRSATSGPGPGVPRARRVGDGAAPAAQPHPRRARRAGGPSRRRASPRPSQPVAGSSTSRRIAGASPTLKATKW